MNSRVRKNILFAKKYMVESIYRAANVEGLGFTFPETQTICDGMSVSGHPVDDIEAVVDLKHAWQWIFEDCSSRDQGSAQGKPEIDVDTLKTLSRISGKNTVINAGDIRTIYDDPIRVTLRDGRYFYPEVPDQEKVSAELAAILSDSDKTDAAFEVFCFVAKLQAFNDGNKRVATLAANMVMILNGCGILSVPEEKIKEFYDALIDFYDMDKKKELKDFLRTYCYTEMR